MPTPVSPLRGRDNSYRKSPTKGADDKLVGMPDSGHFQYADLQRTVRHTPSQAIGLSLFCKDSL